MIEEKNIKIGQALRTARVSAGVSQTELGKKIGVTFQQIQKYEKGANRISTKSADKICKILGASPMIFFDDYPSTTNLDLEVDGMEVICRILGKIKDKKNRNKFLESVKAIGKLYIGEEEK